MDYVVTNAGIAAAIQAGTGGPKIELTEFRLGTGVNYTPTTADTGLHGTLLHTAAITGYSIIDDNTCEVRARINPDVGNFSFGEIGIYMADGTCFALGSLTALQQKIAQPATGWNTIIARARLTLSQLPALIQWSFNNLILGVIPEVQFWTQLETPQDAEGNAYIVHDNDEEGEPVLVIKDSETEWGLIGYRRMLQFNTSSATGVTQSQLTLPDLNTIAMAVPNTSSRYLVKFPDGSIRKVSNQTGGGQTLSWSPSVSVVPSGAMSVWETDSSASQVGWIKSGEYNDVLAYFNGMYSTPSGAYPTSNQGANQVALSPAVGNPTAAQILEFKNRLITMCTLKKVDTTDLAALPAGDFLPKAAATTGLESLRQNWEVIREGVAELYANRNVVDTAQLENLPSTTIVSYSDPTYFSGIRTYDFTATYANDATLDAHVNTGAEFRIFVDCAVTGGTNPVWNSLAVVLSNMGYPYVVKDDNTFTAGGFTFNLGLGGLTSSYQTIIYQSAGGWTVQWQAKRVSNVITFRLTLNNSGTPPNPGSGPAGTLNISMVHRRAKTSLIANPVLANPAGVAPAVPAVLTPESYSTVRTTVASVSTVVSTYAPTGAATATLLTGTMAPGLTLTTPNSTDILLSGTTGASPGTYNSTWTITTGGQSAILSLTITVSDGGVIQLTNHSRGVMTYGEPSIACEAWVDFQSDGALRYAYSGYPGFGDITLANEWFGSGHPVSTGTTGLYEIMATLTPVGSFYVPEIGLFIANTNPDVGTMGTWLQLNTLRQWKNSSIPASPSVSGPVRGSSIDFQIRRIATGVVQATCTITLVCAAYFYHGETGD